MKVCDLLDSIERKMVLVWVGTSSKAAAATRLSILLFDVGYQVMVKVQLVDKVSTPKHS